MEYTYEYINNEDSGETIKRTDENGLIAWIPIDPANSDYQIYLNYETQQSTPIESAE
jgi:hypothetical protein